MKTKKLRDGRVFLISFTFILAIYYYVFNLSYLNNEMSDVANYFAARNNYLYLVEELDGVWSFITQSGAFWIGYGMLGHVIEDDAQLLFSITGMVLLITSYLLDTKNKRLCLINALILLHPRVLDLMLSQQRTAFALAMFLVALGCNNKISRALFYLVALSMHLAIIILISVSALHTLARREDIRVLLTSWHAFGGKKIPDSLYVFSSFALCFILSIVIYGNMVRPGFANTYGPLGTYEIALWVITLFPVLIFSSRRLIEKEGFIFLFVFLLAVTSPLTGLYGPRLLSISLVLLAVWLQKTSPRTTYAFALVFPVNMLVSYLY